MACPQENRQPAPGAGCLLGYPSNELEAYRQPKRRPVVMVAVSRGAVIRAVVIGRRGDSAAVVHAPRVSHIGSRGIGVRRPVTIAGGTPMMVVAAPSFGFRRDAKAANSESSHKDGCQYDSLKHSDHSFERRSGGATPLFSLLAVTRDDPSREKREAIFGPEAEGDAVRSFCEASCAFLARM